MSTAAPSPPVTSVPPSGSVLLEGVSWELYERFLDEIQNRLRHVYDDGTLELMTITFRHEWAKKLLARLIETFSEELGIPIRSAGSLTLKRAARLKGIEPDETYWVSRESQMRSKAEFDPQTDPPPDLAIEVEVTRSVLNRIEAYGAIGVPEIWRWRDGAIVVLLRQDDETYVESAASLAFPQLPVSELSSFIGRIEEIDETTLVREFRHWVRERFRDHLPAD